MINLDKIAAERAQAMVNKALNMQKVSTFERLTTKALGVLQEQGVYALIIFLFSRKSDEFLVSLLVLQELLNTLHDIPSHTNNEDLRTLIGDDALSEQNMNNLHDQDRKRDADNKIRTHAQKTLKFYADQVLTNLDQLLLVRDLYEQTMIYARYNAKAVGG
jgi:hypothetical protein